MLIAAGYYGLVPGPPPDWIDAKYSGTSLVSLCDELVRMVPGPTWTTSTPNADLVDVGVPKESTVAAAAWLDDAWSRGDLLYPKVFRRPSVLVDFLARFAPESPTEIIGAALDADEVPEFLAEHDRVIGQEDGMIEMLRAGEELAPGYRVLGYEPVEANYGGFGCSWTLHLLQPDVERATGVVPNGDGFIATREEAQAVMAYIARPDVGKEPGVWRAWLVVSYPR